MYDLPLLHKTVKYGYCSLLYCFVHKTVKFLTGYAVSYLNRLNDHINIFNGHRSISHLHEWVIDNGDVSSVKWAPIIIYDNIVQQW